MLYLSSPLIITFVFMTLQELLKRFFVVVARDVRHDDYKLTVKRAELYKTLITGEGMDALLQTYVRRESEDLFEQRKRLTIHIISSICKNLLDIFYKVPRSNAARKTIAYSTDTDTNISKLNKILAKFWGEFTFEDYLESRNIDIESIDPNAFIVYEFKPFANAVENVQPYPFEVMSKDALDYKYINNVLQYLICQTEVETIIDPNKLADASNMEKSTVFTMYTPTQVFQLKKVKASLASATVEGVIVSGTGGEFVLLGKDTYQLISFTPHNLGWVQARKVGYVSDKIHNNIYLNCIDAAIPFLMKTIKTNSELDLTATLVAFPQMLMYGNVCENNLCTGGMIGDTGAKCPTCKGTGFKATANSAQDAITIKMPRSKEEMIPLDTLIHYDRPPVDIIEWQEAYINSCTDKAKQIVFNSDIFTREEVAATATGKNISLQNVYDTLYPFAKNYARAWQFGIKTIANLADLDNGLTVICSFDKDFKLKSLEDLIGDLKLANDSGANNSLIDHINDDIALIIYDGRPQELQKYKTRAGYNPFAGKSDKEIAIQMNMNYIPKKKKVFYANFGAIFDELEAEQAKGGIDFYKLTREKQLALISAKIDEYVGLVDADYAPIELPTATV